MTFYSEDERRAFIETNLGLVVSRVLFLNKQQFNDDLYQVGSLALILAVDRFKEDKGVKFASFAVPYIDGTIRHYRNHDVLIKPSRLAKCGHKCQYKNVISLDMPYRDYDCTYGDTLVGECNLELDAVSKVWIDLFKARYLSEREQVVFQMLLDRFTLREIAKVMGISDSYVGIIKKNIRKKYNRYTSKCSVS